MSSSIVSRAAGLEVPPHPSRQVARATSSVHASCAERIRRWMKRCGDKRFPPGRCGIHSRHSARFYRRGEFRFLGKKKDASRSAGSRGKDCSVGDPEARTAREVPRLVAGWGDGVVRPKAVGAPGPQVGLASHSPHRLDVRGDKPHREEGRATAENSSVACADHGSQGCEEPAPPPVRLSFGDAGLLCLHAILRFFIRMHRALFAPVPVVLAVTFEAAR